MKSWASLLVALGAIVLGAACGEDIQSGPVEATRRPSSSSSGGTGSTGSTT